MSGNFYIDLQVSPPQQPLPPHPTPENSPMASDHEEDRDSMAGEADQNQLTPNKLRVLLSPSAGTSSCNIISVSPSVEPQGCSERYGVDHK